SVTSSRTSLPWAYAAVALPEAVRGSLSAWLIFQFLFTNVHPAGGDMVLRSIRHRDEWWVFFTFVDPVDAPWREGASLRQIAHVRRRAFDREQLLVLLVQAWQRAEQPQRVRVARVVVDVL